MTQSRHDSSPSRSIQVDQQCRCVSRAPEYTGSAQKGRWTGFRSPSQASQRRAARYPALDQNPSRLRQPIVLPFRPVRESIREISDEIHKPLTALTLPHIARRNFAIRQAAAWRGSRFHRCRGKFFRDRFPIESVGGRRAGVLCFFLVPKSQKSFEVCTISIN